MSGERKMLNCGYKKTKETRYKTIYANGFLKYCVVFYHAYRNYESFNYYDGSDVPIRYDLHEAIGLVMKDLGWNRDIDIEVLIAKRKTVKLRQEDVAAAFNVNLLTVRKWERGKLNKERAYQLEQFYESRVMR